MRVDESIKRSIVNSSTGATAIESVRESLDYLFAGEDFREAHKNARSLLAALVESDSFLHEILRKNLQSDKFLSSVRINPVIALPVIESPKYTLVANCWIPRPDGDTGISHQSIHHHGNLLLTSAAAFGPGYESILFKKGFQTDYRTLKTTMEVDQQYINTRGTIEFVDTHAPHIVFYPKSLSVTYALWSKEKWVRANGLVRSPLVEKYKAPLKKLLKFSRLSSFFSVNQMSDFDFYPEKGAILMMRDRIQYTSGTRANFLQALWYVVRNTGFRDKDALRKLRTHCPESEIRNVFEDHHLFIPKVTLRKVELLDCLD